MSDQICGALWVLGVGLRRLMRSSAARRLSASGGVRTNRWAGRRRYNGLVGRPAACEESSRGGLPGVRGAWWLWLYLAWALLRCRLFYDAGIRFRRGFDLAAVSDSSPSLAGSGVAIAMNGKVFQYLKPKKKRLERFLWRFVIGSCAEIAGFTGLRPILGWIRVCVLCPRGRAAARMGW